MLTGRTVWRTGPDQSLTAEQDGLRLVVHALRRSGQATYVCIRRGAGGDRIIVGSGSAPNLRAAMMAAEQVAAQITGRQTGRD
jgi:hypothetical protein